MVLNGTKLRNSPTGICQITKGNLQEPRVGPQPYLQVQRENTNQGTCDRDYIASHNATQRHKGSRSRDFDYTEIGRSIRIIVDNI
jgi:hypothetical protein